MNETEALELVHAVEAQDGQGSRTWQVTPVEDLGWTIAAIGVRSNGAYAVTRTGRVGRYVISTTRPREALEKLAALPDPRSQAEVADAAAAERLVETALARFGSLGQTGWITSSSASSGGASLREGWTARSGSSSRAAVRSPWFRRPTPRERTPRAS